MGQCLSSVGGDAPEVYRGRWAQQGGLADGFAAFGDGYTTNADVGLGGPRGSGEPGAGAPPPPGYGFAAAHKPPPALQLERIDEEAALAAGVPEGSPMKPLPGLSSGGPPVPGGGDAGCTGRRAPVSWTRGELVGQGAYGSVFVAMDNDTGELIAAKQVAVPRGGGSHARKVEENIRSVEEEVALLQQFDHPNIVRYLGTEKGSDALTIFLEYVPGGSIASLLAKFGSFKESVVRVYTKQILQGLEYLHSKGVMHRDIKGANILVDNTGLVKLADFGASKKLEDLATLADGNKSVRGTPYWMAPEVITQTGHGRQADLWSVACTVLEMATGRPPWSAQYPSQVAAMFHIASCKGPPEIPQHLSPECKDFLYLCFNRDWKARPLAATLLRHPFLADVPVRSHAQASPTATLAPALAAARRLAPPRGAGAGAVDEPAAGFGTPSPLNPRVAAAQAGLGGGAARISLADGGSGGLGDSTAALSPLGTAASTRGKQQWDAAAPALQQQQQQFGGRAGGSSPVKRAGLSLRASAPAFSGYASVALSQQGSEQLTTPKGARAGAAPAPSTAVAPQQPRQQQQQPAGSSHLRGSRESTGAAASSGSRPQLDGEASSQAAAPVAATPVAATPVAAAPIAAVPVAATPVFDTPAAAPAEPAGEPAAVAASETPAPQRPRPGGVLEAAPDSGGHSSGTSKSDWNPMEEPSWMHPAESPLGGGEGTPTSALTGGATAAGVGSPEQRAGAAEVSSYALAPSAAAAEALAPAAAAPPPAEPAAEPFGTHPSADGHLVWTNEDGDIDALPWDMGGWSTGSSGERAEAAAAALAGSADAENAGAPGQQQQQQQPVGEDALIGALRRKAHHDVRASLALFEKSLNIPALHGQPPLSPKAVSGGIPAVRGAQPPALALPSPPAEPVGELAPSAESIEGRGGVGAAPLSARRRSAQQLAASAPGQQAAVAHLLAGVRETASGALPPPAPLASAVSGLAVLGGYGSTGALGGGDREAIWQQELSQELFRVKAAGGGGSGVPNRRTSMHGSPVKRPHA